MFLIHTPLAHSPIEGINSFYNGLLHPVLVPAQLLLLIAWGLFLIQTPPENNRPALLAYVIAAAGGLIFAWFSIAGEMQLFLLGGAVIIGLLVAAERAGGAFICASIAALAGFFVGMDSAQDGLSGTEKLLSFLGCSIGLFFLPTSVFAALDYLSKSEWRRVGVRILGSWVAAVSLLVLALSFSPAGTE